MRVEKLTRFTIGYCPVCSRKTIFLGIGYWNRDYYLCVRCRSIPRQRAIMRTLKEICPDYKNKVIHQSSPSVKEYGHQFFLRECKNYSYSYFYPEKSLGKSLGDRCSNENLEKLTFPNESFDIFITQDVFEHTWEPLRAFKEIERCLKPGGFHIFTTPIDFYKTTKKRVEVVDGELKHLLEPVYHGNPINPNGSLVTYDWGGDIVTNLSQVCPFMTHKLYTFRNSKQNYNNGIEGDFLEVIVSKKSID